jgi:hypothetical protein
MAKYLDGIQQIEKVSNEPIPVLIGTIPYTQFLASATKFANYDRVLNRRAKSRTFIFCNTMNQSITGPSINPYESTVKGALGVGGEGSAISSISTQFMLVTTDEARLQTTANVDSVSFALGMGATAPTSGDLKIYVVEVLD